MSEQPTSNERVCEDNLRIIYEHGQPYGIRDRSGYLFFFRKVSKFDNQEERYRNELYQMASLADFLLAALRAAHEPAACEHGAHPPTNCAICTGQPPRTLHQEVMDAALMGLRNLLELATNHIDMETLRISHCKDWALLVPFVSKPSSAQTKEERR